MRRLGRRAGVAKPRRAGRKAEAREAVERWPSALIIVVGPGVVSLASWELLTDMQ